jgi:DNA-binding CsgD family transcriptional regulator
MFFEAIILMIIGFMVQNLTLDDLVKYFQSLEAPIFDNDKDKDHKNLVFPFNYDENETMTLTNTAFKSFSLFEILKPLVLIFLFTTDELSVMQDKMLNDPVTATLISQQDRRRESDQICQFCHFYNIKTKFRLFFLMFSTQFDYVNCERLSQRENEVLNLLCSGNTRSEIMEKLNIKNSTISSIKTNILYKYGVNNSREALIEVLKETGIFNTPIQSLKDLKFF